MNTLPPHLLTPESWPDTSALGPNDNPGDFLVAVTMETAKRNPLASPGDAHFFVLFSQDEGTLIDWEEAFICDFMGQMNAFSDGAYLTTKALNPDPVSAVVRAVRFGFDWNEDHQREILMHEGKHSEEDIEDFVDTIKQGLALNALLTPPSRTSHGSPGP